MKKVKECLPYTELPSALLWEILGRVPAKTCLTCKLVCKEWHNIIVAPEFSSFRRLCIASRFSLLFHNGLYYLFPFVEMRFNLVEIDKALDADDLRKCVVGVVRLRVEPIIDSRSQRWRVSSHCNGVVFFGSIENDYFAYNVLTGQHVKLENLHQLMNESCYLSGCELGCCPVSDQFKVLVFLQDKANKIHLAKIQTLGNGEWRSVGNSPLEYLNDGCFLNGSRHWYRYNCIWSFHFGKEEFLQIPFHDDIISEAYNYKKKYKMLSVFDSCLCLSCFSGSDKVEMDIWIMKEYGVKGSWVRQFVIMVDAWTLPLKQMNKGKILVRRGYELYLYDPLTQTSKRVEFEFTGSAGSPELFDASFSRF